MLGAHGRAFAFAFVATMLLVAGPAWADVRYAEPAPGDGDPTMCAQSDPCDIQTAVEDPSVNGGDTVIVLPGTYSLATNPLTPTTAITIQGGPGQPVPRLVATSGNALALFSGTARRLYVESASGTGSVVDLIGAGVVGEQLEVVGTGTTGRTVQLRDGALLRDSFIWNRDFAGSAVVTGGSGAAMRNVTAIASTAGGQGVLSSADFGPSQVVTLHNVIARGAGQGIDAEDNGAAPEPDDIDVTVTNSNYSSVSEAPPEAEVVEGPGNQTGPPLFANEATGDFHQLAGSPTIDAGAVDPLLGAVDIDGEPRNQGPAPDIGADEFTVIPPPAANRDTFPPDTKILKGPKKRTKKRKAKFQFGGSEPGLTFECSLDEKAFKPCNSPEKFRSLKRTRHVFAVRAVDAAGNRDPTPADRKWSIRKKKKKKRRPGRGSPRGHGRV
jgi:hypothetical protein